MRFLPALLTASLVGNLAFGLALRPRTAAADPSPSPAVRTSSERDPAGPARWSALATDDSRSLAERLRAAGFPADVIRAVIQARVSARYDAEMRALSGRSTQELPYWQPRSYAHGTQARINETWSRLVTERGRALREALTAAGLTTAADEATAAERRQYGNLPAGKVALVERINADYAELRAQVRDAAQGITLPSDLAAVALLEKERRRDLAAVLSPSELEDYLLRTSTVTERLRTALTLMDANEAEFRAIHAAYAPFAETLFPTLQRAGYSPDAAQQRRDATTAVTTQLQSTLGAGRAAAFERANTYEFQSLSRMAAGANLPGDAAASVWDIRNRTMGESVRIGDDPTLSVEQRRAALTALADQTRAQVTATLGSPLGTAYLQGASWLSAIAQGMTVRADAGGVQFRSVQTGPRIVVPEGGSATVTTTQTTGAGATTTTTTRTTTIRVEGAPSP